MSRHLPTTRRQLTRNRRSFVPDQVVRSALEARQLLSTATLSSAGVLTVTGTNGPDTIAVLQSGAWVNAAGSTFATSSVRSIVVNGLDGSDSISVASSIPATLNGGAGANTYPSVPGNDTIIDPILTGGVAMSKAVMDKYQALGGSNGLLGKPTGDETAAFGGRVARFQGGEIDYSAATGTHEVHGAIFQELAAAAGEVDAYGTPVRNDLGLAKSDELAGFGGRLNYFQGGDIEWSAATGAHPVYGAIFGEYNATAAETDFYGHSVQGILGLPTADEAATAGGRVSHFQGGDIYYSSSTGAHVVYGGIRSAWVSYGKEQGLIGLPTVDEHAGPAGSRVSTFQNGGINDSATGVIQLSFNRQQLIGAIDKSVPDGVLDAGEFSFFKNIAENPTVSIDSADRNLIGKFIDGDPANALEESTAVGNLAPGCSSVKVIALERKWFKGLDQPAPNYVRTNADGTHTTINGGTYTKATGPLFGAGGPVYTDVYQGAAGDCYLLATLAETAFRSPSTIRGMFTDNGDGTYAVRFYHNGSATYVTVDNQLPSGGATFDHPNAGPIWVALAEKAYAQLNQSGWLQTSVVGANSYAALDGGGQVSVALPAITGQTASASTTSSYGTTQLATDWAAGKSLWLDTSSTKSISYLVPGHVYAVVGYNATTGIYTLFNPWGVDGGNLNGVHKSGTVSEPASSITSDFTYAERNTSSAPDAEVVSGATTLVPNEPAASSKPASLDITHRSTPMNARATLGEAGPVVSLFNRPTQAVRLRSVHPGQAGTRDLLADFLRS